MTSTPALASPACRRCGQCCLKGGPALHLQDLPLLQQGIIRRECLVTLRQGEVVHENVAGELAALKTEMVKLSGSGKGYACGFYDTKGKSCLIHASRPAECRALLCEDTSAIQAMYAKDRLTRADLVDTRGGLWELILFHEGAFPAAMAMDLARKAAHGQERARGKLMELARAEQSFRRAFQKQTGTAAREMDFYFGRELPSICAPFGVRFAALP